MIKPRIGLLLLYLQLYDDAMPEMRPHIEAFAKTIAGKLEGRGIIVNQSPVCRTKEEFSKAIKSFESKKVDAIVTLHLAYSPSLESTEVLSKTKIPIIVLDTTQTYDFNPGTNPEDIMYNHGIHGVQDMCSVLIRKGKNFIIEAGHWEKSDVLNRIVRQIKAASIANVLQNIRVGSIGGPFIGMGDFYVSPEILKKTIGIETVNTSTREITSLLPLPDDKEVKEEIKLDAGNFQIDKLSRESHVNTIRIGIAIRRWIKKENLGAFTVNFSEIGKDSGFPTFPFLEASKQMANGIGYAGEGDVLTAALTGALLSVFPETSFVEMFCPDWKGNRIFLSHMGEMNINLVSGKPKLIQKDLPFLDIGNPAVAFGRFKPGEAVFVNLTPLSKNTYKLIVSPVTMVDIEGEDKMIDTIRGWFTPKMPVEDFLAEFSRAGGTHHSTIVYGNTIEEIMSFGKMMGWNVVEI
jgi:L-arabinose isomerase